MAEEDKTTEGETPGVEAPSEETAPNTSDEAPTPEAESAPPPPAAEAAAPAPRGEPQEQVAPKERRRRARVARAAKSPVRGQRTPEERHAERVAERRRKAELRSTRRRQEREKARAGRPSAPTPEPLAPRREEHPGQQKTRQGIVVSDRASKTIVVRIDVTRRHPFYEKIVRTSRTLHAHDEREDAHIGDTVVVRESRPLSRTKRWRLVEVLERAK